MKKVNEFFLRIKTCPHDFCVQAEDSVYSMVTEAPNLQMIQHKDKESSTASQQQQQQQHRPLLVGHIQTLGHCITTDTSITAATDWCWSKRMKINKINDVNGLNFADM